ncbi:MAG: MBOAT family protein [Bacteroidetes bacterium]|nr:MBOAT family protein [Bacteroidota bacterium]
MIFNSLTFLAFIAIFLPIYFSLKGNARLWLSLFASYVFYGWWDWRFLTLISLSTFIDYYLGAVIRNGNILKERKTWYEVFGYGMLMSVLVLGLNLLSKTAFPQLSYLEYWYFPTLGLWLTFLVIYLTNKISTAESRGYRMMVVSMVLNLGFLGFFKYFNFFTDSFDQMLGNFGMHASWNTLNIILPVGISFYTFQSMSYTIDVYRKEIEPELNYLKFATFVAFWPQLVAGPIVRAVDFLPQFQKDHNFHWNRVITGTGRVLWGFFKKCVVADSLAPFVDQIFHEPNGFASINLVIAVFFYAFQIYCDFSGYSDIAIGFARILGFDFNENFKTPYFSQNFSEFWSRWHISLSSWLRDYLYIPLGGNRNGKFNTYKNNMLTMLLGGLWHGANWTFVFWGFLHGLYLIAQRQLGKPFGSLMSGLRFPSWMKSGVNIASTFFFTCLAWIFFRSANFGIATDVIKGIASFQGFSMVNVMNKFTVMKGFLLIGILLTIEVSNIRMHWNSLAFERPSFRVVAYATLLLLLAFFGSFGSGAFIYFQF